MSTKENLVCFGVASERDFLGADGLAEMGQCWASLRQFLGF